MKRTWRIIAVDDVLKSSASYTGLLDAKNNYAGGTVFDQYYIAFSNKAG